LITTPRNRRIHFFSVLCRFLSEGLTSRIPTLAGLYPCNEVLIFWGPPRECASKRRTRWGDTSPPLSMKLFRQTPLGFFSSKPVASSPQGLSQTSENSHASADMILLFCRDQKLVTTSPALSLLFLRMVIRFPVTLLLAGHPALPPRIPFYYRDFSSKCPWIFLLLQVSPFLPICEIREFSLETHRFLCQ